MQNKAIFITIILMVLLAIFITMFNTSAAINLLGDSNCDNKVDIMDTTCIQQHLAKITNLSEQGIINAKVSAAKNVTIQDATYIQQKLAKIIETFPAESTETSLTETTENTKVTSSPTEKTETPTKPMPTQIETVPPVSNIVDIYFSNSKSWQKVYAYIYNYKTESPKKAWPGDLMTLKETNEYGEGIYTTSVDISKYDRIVFNNGDSYQTTDTPVCAASSGFFPLAQCGNSKKDKWICGVYPYGEIDEGKIETTTLDYPKSSTHAAYKKKITVWLPKGYTKTKKYSVLYMCDGQNMFGNDPNCAPYEWEADETILSLQKNGGDGIIVVGIDNCTNRDSELTPPITSTPKDPTAGGKKFTTPTGDVFSNFIVNSVVPYIDAHYSTNSIRGIGGSSSGGIEAFYIGIEHPDMFNYIGALSPAFLLFNQSEWQTYLSSKNFSKTAKLPNIYLYQGNSIKDSLEQAIYSYGKDMNTWLTKNGYSNIKIKSVTDNDGFHSELFWAVYLPESLSFGLSFTN